MSPKQKRDLIRIVHLIGAALLGTYIYAPWKDVNWFTLLVQLIVIPALTISGIYMWKPTWFQLGNNR